jgi:hypothetical protein
MLLKLANCDFGTIHSIGTYKHSLIKLPSTKNLDIMYSGFIGSTT